MKKILIWLLSLLGLMSCNRNKNTDNSKQKRTDGVEVINKLESLGFFSMTDKNYLDSAKKVMVEYCNKSQFFHGLMTNDDYLAYVDNRFYSIDSEELFEIGGIEIYLKTVKPTFEKLGLKLEYSNEKHVELGNYWKHTINLNGREYIAFEGEMKGYNMWSIAYLNFILMLNEELKNQKSDERIYPVREANDGEIVFLSEEMFKYVSEVYPKDKDNPKSIADWKKENGL